MADDEEQQTPRHRRRRRSSRERAPAYREPSLGAKPSPGESRELRDQIRRQLRDGMNPDDVANQLSRRGRDPEWARTMVEKVDVALETAVRRRGRRRELARHLDDEELELIQTRGSRVLVYGVLGLVLCQLLAPVAWMAGNSYLRLCSAHNIKPSDGAIVGRVLGIVGTGFISLFGLLMLCAVVAGL